MLKRHIIRFSSITKDELLEFNAIQTELKGAIDGLFEPDLYNYLQCGNAMEHLHVHRRLLAGVAPGVREAEHQHLPLIIGQPANGSLVVGERPALGLRAAAAGQTGAEQGQGATRQTRSLHDALHD